MAVERHDEQPGVAIIGMAGRFPGAPDVAALWHNLLAGAESISRFTADDLLARGGDPARAADPGFVGAEGVLDDIESFDAGFFGCSPREAAIMDPQHRLALETAWHAFEDAGCRPARRTGPVGVFLSAALSSYLVRNLLPNRELVSLLGGFPLLIHNDKDFAATTIAHRLRLTGPALAVGSACSSSLVAVHLACQSLQTHESDMALAGGVSLQVPHGHGYVHTDDGVYSADGRCRPFDAEAGGAVGGSGVAMVLLKRLGDALADQDRIYAVIRGSAVNNDGGSSVGYTAPSVEGQQAVVAEAIAMAGIRPGDIGYVETHGTGTPLGDPIEVEALTGGFGLAERSGDGAGSPRCAIGSVKANLGHLDAAAGVTSLIKAALAVRHGTIPPHPTFRTPNREIDLGRTPFYVNTEVQDWPGPRHAGVSSFGIGGTNAHLVLGQAPDPEPPDPPARRWHLLAVSARDPETLADAAERLAAHVADADSDALADVAYTTARREQFRRRRAVVCHDGEQAARELRSATPRTGSAPGAGPAGDVSEARPAVFLFPGQGAGDVGVAGDLHRQEPAFRRHLDECLTALATAGAPGGVAAELGLGDAPRRGSGPPAAGDGPHTEPDAGQCALFALEHALGHALLDWGLVPAAVAGHSLGEYAAAVAAGALTLDDAARLVVARGRVQRRLPPGAMLAVRRAEPDLRPLPAGVSLAAVNGPSDCVLAGDRDALRLLADRLRRDGAQARWLPASRAFHSHHLEPLLAEFSRTADQVSTASPRVGWMSTRAGDWVSGPVAGEHWVRHLRDTVRFGDATRRLLELDGAVFLEVGPGSVLTSLVRRDAARRPHQTAFETLPDPPREAPPLLSAVATAWEAGCTVDLGAAYRGERRALAACPPYPFRKERHWVEAPAAQPAGPGPAPAIRGLADDLRDELATLTAEQPPRGMGDRPGLGPLLDELCSALALGYLAECGVETSPGGVHKVADLRDRLAVLPAYHRFLDYLLGLLREDGVLREEEAGDGGAVRFTEGRRPRSSHVVADELRRRHPEFTGLVDLLLHCGAAYPEALRRPGGGLETLFPGGGGDLLRDTLGERTVEFSVTGRLVRLAGTLVRRMLRQTTSRRLRVLEVGAGSGRLTWEVAEALRGSGAEHLVTDIGRLFLEHLSDAAARRGLDIQVRPYDISADPGPQGIAGPYDLILGLDVVHATPDVPATLGRLRDLLAPGGLLGLVETVSADRWLSLVWGLTEEWWSFRDQLRVRTPLLTPERWREAFAAQGLIDPAVLAPTPDSDAVLVLGQSPAAGAPAAAGVGNGLARLPGKRPDIASWGYVPSWRRAAPASAAAAVPGPCLLFADGPFGDAVADRLGAAGLPVAVVRPGDRLGNPSPGAWTLDPARGDDYAALLDGVLREVGPPRYLAHLWQAERPQGGDPLSRIESSQQRGLLSLLALAKAMSARVAGPARLIAVTGDGQDVIGGDLRAPDRSTVHSAIKVISREYPHVTCRGVDVSAPESGSADADWLAERLVDELLGDADELLVAYRGRGRWLPGHTPLRLAPVAAAGQPSAPVRASGAPAPGGVYLICGGLGGIGLSVAESLGRLPARVVLVRRTPFPPRELWPELAARRPAHDADASLHAAVRRLLDIEAHGGEVLVLTGDVTSLDEMRAVVRRAVERFGPITGAVHAAGEADVAGVIQRRTAEDTWQAVAAKVRGPLVLEAALADQRPEFVVLCSSIGALLHKLKFGEVGYVAGNDFLTAYAASRHRDGNGATVAISWTDWLEAGMWADARRRLAARYAADDRFHPADDLLRGVTTAEGVEVFHRILASPAPPHVIVSTQDLDALTACHDGFSHADHVRALDTMRPVVDGRRRPELGTPYAAPRTEQERAAVAICENLLGIDGIGVTDDFFDLGGDSLVALRFLARLRDDLGVERSVADMFQARSIAGLLGEHDEVVL